MTPRRLLGLFLACAGLLVLLAVLGGQHTFLGIEFSCGGRFTRHDCAEGGIPGRVAFVAVLTVGAGLALAFGSRRDAV